MRKIYSMFKLSYSIFLKRLGINFLLAAQLCLCIVAINYSSIEINQLKRNISIIRSIENTNTIFVMIPREIRLSKGEKALDLDTINAEYELGEASQTSIVTSYGVTNMFLYSDALISNINIPLSKGSWNQGTKFYDGEAYHPIIISSENNGYKFGDRFTIGLQNDETVRVYVAGVLSNDQKYITLSTSTNDMLADHFIDQCAKTDNVFFCNKSLMPDIVEDNAFEYYNKIIFFDENLSAQQFREVSKQIQKQAYVVTLEDLVCDSIANVKMYQGYYEPLCACLCVVSLVGLLSFSMLLSNRNIKYYSNIILCGGSKRECVILSFLNVIFVNILSLILLVIMCNILTVKGSYIWDRINGTNILMTLTVLILNILINYIMVSVIVKSKSRVQLVNMSK